MTNYLETGVVISKPDGTEDVYQIPYNINNILITEKDILKSSTLQISIGKKKHALINIIQ